MSHPTSPLGLGGPYNYSYPLLLLTFLQTNYASPKGAILRLGAFDNTNPRADLDKMEKSGKFSPRLVEKLRRRQAAHENCYDNLGIFAAAVVAGNQVGLGPRYMNTMTGLYFSFRCLYIWLYINGSTRRQSFLRSATWWACNFCFLTTFWKATTAINGGKSLLSSFGF